MLTDLQKRKLTVLFHLQDMNHDGYLARDDYEEYAQRLCAGLGLAPGSPEHDAMVAQTLAAWDNAVLSAFDRDGDNRISLQEHLASYDVSLNDPVMHKQLVTQYATSVLKLWDRDGDGKLSGAEWVAVLGCYGVPDKTGRVSFEHLDRDRDGHLSTEEILKAVEEFYLSDDPDAPGNWLIGQF
jgi:Ca2+-binding EF-hand superfamily protein